MQRVPPRNPGRVRTMKAKGFSVTNLLNNTRRSIPLPDTAAPHTGRFGYSLIEVMIAVSLTLVLMYAIAAIFGRVSSIMSQTQATLAMTNNLRTTRDRLISDLSNLTVPTLKGPVSKYGYFCYVEGANRGNATLLNNLIGTDRASNYYSLIYPNTDRTVESTNIYGNFDNSRNFSVADTTAGDTDDILSFTVRAPAGKWFRGRVFKEKPDYSSSIDDNIEMIESEYAEVIWFVRGNTLYRRTLLVIPDGTLQKRLTALDNYLAYMSNDFATVSYTFNRNGVSQSIPILPSTGFGFFRYFDVSVHYDPHRVRSYNLTEAGGTQFTIEGCIVANTLSDLSNRKNRYGYWSSPVLDSSSRDISDPANVADLGRHGWNNAWYWLRMPTLQESATCCNTGLNGDYPAFRFFRAGFPFGNDDSEMLNIDWNTYGSQFWWGFYETLTYQGPQVKYQKAYASALPDFNRQFDADTRPFMDLWLAPNPWAQQDPYSGQLLTTGITNNDTKAMNQDVILTNVLCFDVKILNNSTDKDTDGNEYKYAEFVDLGQSMFNGDELNDPTDFRSAGNYGGRQNLGLLYPPAGMGDTPAPYSRVLFYRPFMPAVFDTWTEDYEKEFLSSSWDGGNTYGMSRIPGFSIDDIPLDAPVKVSEVPDYPPPYEAEAKAIRVELRVFDPGSRTIKNSTVEINLAD